MKKLPFYALLPSALLLSLLWTSDPKAGVRIQIPKLTKSDIAAIRSKAASGDALSQTLVGDWHCSGTSGVTESFREAAAWYAMAAQRGNEAAQIDLGAMYEFGLGVRQDHEKAMELIEQGIAHRTDVDARSLPRGLSKQDAAQRIKAIHRIRFAGVAFNMGLAYGHIYGGYTTIPCFAKVPKNLSKAIEWLRLSAQAGNAQAAWRLGALYESEPEVKNFAAAMQWYRKAAAARWSFAMVDIGQLYAHGEGVPRDYRQAAMWYREATATDGFSGRYELAWLYEHGLGAPRDLRAALQLYHQVPGAQDAQRRMFAILQMQLHPPQDQQQAINWLREAAEKGNGWAQAGLGLHYEFGAGVPRDWDVALALYTVAATSRSAAGQDVPDLRHTFSLDGYFSSRDVTKYVLDLTRNMSIPGNLLKALDSSVAHPPRRFVTVDP